MQLRLPRVKVGEWPAIDADTVSQPPSGVFVRAAERQPEKGVHCEGAPIFSTFAVDEDMTGATPEGIRDHGKGPKVARP